MTDSLVTARVEEARVLLAEARTLDDVKDLTDKAKALEQYARRRSAASAAHGDAWEILQLAQRRMGQLTRELPTAAPGRKSKRATVIGSEPEPKAKREVLAELGLSKTQVHRWEGLATLDDIEFAARVERGKASVTKDSDASSSMAATSSASGYDSDSYGTPADWLDAAREVAGGEFDLDPATNAEAQQLVRAAKFFTKETNGLTKFWKAKRLWLNQPYSDPLVGDFAAKFLREWHHKRFEVGFELVNNSTDTKWFQALLAAGLPVLFPSKRIAFVLNGKPIKGNRYAQALFYAGPDARRFKRVFSKFGEVR